PIGSIHLPISIGAAPQRRTITTPFLIIDCPTAYNVILGRPAMAEMKCVATNLVPEVAMLQQGEALVVTQAHAPPRAGTERPEDPREESVTQQAEPVEDLELVTLDENIPDRQVFAWSYNDMPGISPDIISHRLSINPAIRPVRQKRRAYDPERYEAMRAEIFMHPEDQAHTSFITDRGLYCYKVMPFGLKNAGATYQRLVNSIFAPLIGNTMEVYVDDMLVKSRTTDQHIPNLSAMFTILKQYKMRLNPTKCAFGVASGKFLGFMISQRGIEANPEKIQAILDMAIPKTVKDIQSLTGRVAALTRFISKATDRCAPFFKALKGSKRSITWTAECDKAFNELKEYMSRAPLLSTPEPGDTLMVYLSISATAVSSVLIQTKEGAEHPVHYVSKALQDAEARYSDIEKLAFALVVSARRLRPYFQAHTIHVLTNHPLRQVLQKPETSGRLVKWAIELGEFDIHYKPRPATKGQAVADFISEFTEPSTNRASAIMVICFWPSLHTDAQAFTQKCDKCQRFANIPQLPAEPLTAMVSPWPFAQWGLDLIGPMPEGKGQVKYAVVAVDYFTKWAEAEALATITAARIETFVWQNIVCRFGIPNIIVTDNGRQFDNAKFKQFCSNLKIKLCFASPAHPQSNGQVEAVNKIIKRTLKTKLDKAKGCWPELLPELALNLDFIEELRNQSNMRNVAYKQRIAKYYDSRVKPRALLPNAQ
ncbi:unnamed protein product, partial [Prunus brigantina]